MLNEPVTKLKGIGKVRAELLTKLGIHTVGDLIGFYPRDYRDYSSAHMLAEGSADNVAYLLTVLSRPTVAYFRGLSLVSCKATDGKDMVTLKWYNMPYQQSRVFAGQVFYACGKLDTSKGRALLNPIISETLPGIIPVYPSVKGLKQPFLRNAVRTALADALSEVADQLPPGIAQRYGLVSGALALQYIHFPADSHQLEQARKRIAFESLLLYLVAVNERKQELSSANGIPFQTAGCVSSFQKLLPFPMTGAQFRACNEIAEDMASAKPMNRLIQGDVGSGKTVLAFFAMYVSMRNGKQSVLLAPTEILAEQHFKDLSGLFPGKAVLLRGGMPASEKRRVLNAVRSGEASFVIGTHALLNGDVAFADLGVTITDEQHRFGVAQRAHIALKGIRPDTLVMSATPIPRTLAMLLYGDLDVSNIDEMPPGRLPVKTRYIPPSKRKSMYDYIVSEAKKGNGCYIVCPLIESDDESSGVSVSGLFKELKKAYPQTAIGMLHGEMKREEKEAVMERFRSGALRILVSTTVIEVGVHVASANIMVIEDAERFGLAQLHQLRGRVGRGNRQAYCFLLSEATGENAHERIASLVETTNGFVLAQKDLEMRGPGDFFGTRQHGAPGFESLFRSTDVAWIETIKKAADEIIDIPNIENNAFIEYAKAKYASMSEIAPN